MLPLNVVSVLVALIWGCVGIFWTLITRWEGTFQTEARQREIERERTERVPDRFGKRAWVIVARAVTIGIPLLFIIDGLSTRIVILYAPELSFLAGPDVALQIAGIVMSAVGLAILIGLGRKLAVRVYRLAVEERELMTTGLHKYVQHPFYIHFLMLPVGLFLLTLNYLSLLVLVSYSTLWGPKFVTGWAREEEADLRRRYGADHEAYAAQTGRFFPRFRHR